MQRTVCFAILLYVLAGWWVTDLGATLIDFNSLTHGEKVNTQITGPLGVTISADNVGGGPDLAIIFNSLLTGTADPDLQGPTWSGGNLAPNTILGNLLIIAENAKDKNNDGFIDNPDDEGSRPAGSLIFDFAAPITSFGFDLVDVEGPEEFGVDSGFLAAFFMGGTPLAQVGFGSLVDSGSSFYIPSVAFGNRSANRITPITAAALGLTQFDRVHINLGGSGAVDNINWTEASPHQTPEPSTLILLGSGLFALCLWWLRQRKRQVSSNR